MKNKFNIIMLLFCFGLDAKIQADATQPTPVKAQALTADTTPSATQSAPPEPSAVKPHEETRVNEAYNLHYKDKPKHEYHFTAGLGEIIVVKVQNLASLAEQASCLNDKKEKINGCKEQDISLFLDGRLIKGVDSEAKVVQGRNGYLQFHLLRNSENDEAWADLLGRPNFGKSFFERPTDISVGLANGSPVVSDISGKKFKLMRIRPIRFYLFSVLLVFLLGLVVYKSIKGNLMRDPWPKTETFTGNRPYSLARFQVVFWFFLIIASFVYIWQATGAYETITAGVVALMGIGAGTVLGAGAIDGNKRDEKAAKLSALNAELPVLNSHVANLEARIGVSKVASDTESMNRELADKQKRRNLVLEEIRNLSVETVPPRSEGFLDDVLSDVNGISVHRLQMFAWTWVLGALFVGSVWARLSMPEFSATLLAMQGLSAGTYLGFKIPEKQT